MSQFWNRWRREYLADLREVHRIKNKEPVEVKLGDIVLIQDDNAKRGMWKMGIIEEIIKGKDQQISGGKARKIARGKPEFPNRPLQKLIPLESAVKISLERQDGKKRKEDKGKDEHVTGVREENEKSRGDKPHRAPSMDARWCTQLILDS